MQHFTTAKLLHLRKALGKASVGLELREPDPLITAQLTEIVMGASDIGVEQLANADIRYLSELANDAAIARGLRKAKQRDIWEHVAKRNPNKIVDGELKRLLSL